MSGNATEIFEQARTAYEAGQFTESEQLFAKLIALQPENADARAWLAQVCYHQKRLPEAIAVLQQAMSQRPGWLEAMVQLAEWLNEAGRSTEEAETYRKILALLPDNAVGWDRLGSALQAIERYDEATAAHQKAVSLQPSSGEFTYNLAQSLANEGDIVSAIETYRRAFRLSPDICTPPRHSNLIWATAHVSTDPAELFQLTKNWNDRHAAALIPPVAAYCNDRDPNRPLRVGYVSPDFCRHSVAFFFENILSQHRPAEVETFCYSSTRRADDVTLRLKAASRNWRDIADLPDSQVVAMIRQDRIDILVDLAGHTAGNRLLIFAAKPAPIQITWIGFPGTTGLSTMDWRITDPIADPDGAEKFHSERLLRMADSFLCYRPPDDAPPPGPTPRAKNGFVTFGSFNSISKITPETIRAWSTILKQTPGSRLTLKSHNWLGDPGAKKRLLDQFAANSIPADRVDLRPRSDSPQKHLQLYNDIDIALDTFPYNGTTTTCEALWMGVPVISLAGSAHAGRVGASILQTVGHKELVAANESEFCRIAVELAADAGRLDPLRAKLRNDLARSRLLDGKRFVVDLEFSCRTLWKQWCAATTNPHEARIFAQARREEGAGNWPEAENLFRQFLGTTSNPLEAMQRLAYAVRQQGQSEEAIRILNQAISMRPNSTQTLALLADLLHERRQWAGEADVCRKILAIEPNNALFHDRLGNALVGLGRFDEAVAELQRAVELEPRRAEFIYNLGLAYRRNRRLDLAIDCYQQALRLSPNQAGIHNNLGNALKNIGRPGEAMASYRRALELKPDFAEAHGNVILALLHNSDDAPAILAEMKRWNDLHCVPFASQIPDFSSRRNKTGRLKIGYVSPDFSRHVVGRNLLPLFENHDRRQFEIFFYSNLEKPDDFTPRFMKLCDHWREVWQIDDEKLTQMIRRDEIDILVDLAGHTAHNRLAAFGRRAAPVQITFGGYPGGTGLTTMDYRLTDPDLDPPGHTDSEYIEKLFHLRDSFWCYDARAMSPADEIPAMPPPARANGFITFGCLNNFAKTNSPTLRAWANVLNAVPNSRLLMLTPVGPARDWVTTTLGDAGIAANRIEFVPNQDRSQYLATFHRIDIGLDTLPYNGHTTSLDAMWMGVPMIGWVGKTAVGRAGLSHLRQLGLEELIARDEPEMTRIAVRLAGDVPALAKLRQEMRPRMQRSVLTDAKQFARNIEEAYRRIWQGRMGKQ